MFCVIFEFKIKVNSNEDIAVKMEKIPRKRSSNYTARERELLLNLIEKYINIIENKKTNSVFNKQKIECWEKIAKEFSALQTSGIRSGAQLKACYEQMKKIAKQHQAEDKVGFCNRM